MRISATLLRAGFGLLLLSASTPHPGVLAAPAAEHSMDPGATWSGTALAPRIIGGTAVASIRYMPFLAAIFKSGKFRCTGTILSRTKILTAAHCLRDGTARDFSVLVGSLKLDGSRHVRARDIKIHDRYSGSTVKPGAYDLGTITLSWPLYFTPEINAAPLVASGWGPNAPDTVVAAGWGGTRLGEGTSSMLRQVTLQVIDQDQCAAKYYRRGGQITSQVLCAASPHGDSCQGDSGGPLMEWTKHGPVVRGGISKTTGSCSPDWPSVYVDYGNPGIAKWIEKEINNGL